MTNDWSIVKPVYEDHPWDKKRWPLIKSGRCSEVVAQRSLLRDRSCYLSSDLNTVTVICRWSLYSGGLYLMLDSFTNGFSFSLIFFLFYHILFKRSIETAYIALLLS